MSKAQMITIALTAVAVLVALFVAKTVDKDRAEKLFSN